MEYDRLVILSAAAGQESGAVIKGQDRVETEMADIEPGPGLVLARSD